MGESFRGALVVVLVGLGAGVSPAAKLPSASPEARNAATLRRAEEAPAKAERLLQEARHELEQARASEARAERAIDVVGTTASTLDTVMDTLSVVLAVFALGGALAGVLLKRRLDKADTLNEDLENRRDRYGTGGARSARCAPDGSRRPDSPARARTPPRCASPRTCAPPGRFGTAAACSS